MLFSLRDSVSAQQVVAIRQKFGKSVFDEGRLEDFDLLMKRYFRWRNDGHRPGGPLHLIQVPHHIFTGEQSSDPTRIYSGQEDIDHIEIRLQEAILREDGSYELVYDDIIHTVQIVETKEAALEAPVARVSPKRETRATTTALMDLCCVSDGMKGRESATLLDIFMDNMSLSIRSAGERTFEACRELVRKQVPANSVEVVDECPFEKALKRTYEIGILRGAKWTMTLDADVLLRKGQLRSSLPKQRPCRKIICKLKVEFMIS